VKLFKELSLRAIAHATESIERVKEALKELVGDVKLNETHTTGYHGNEIVILHVNGVKDCTRIEHLLLRDGVLTHVLAEPEKYIEHGVIHLKIDKQVLYAEKRLALANGDAISVHLKVGSVSMPDRVVVEHLRAFLSGGKHEQ
jgi:RNA binding exosome subunit